MICDIILLVFGILALVQGKFSLTRRRVVQGPPARIIGILLIAPLPLSFLVVFAFAGMVAMQPDNPDHDRLEKVVMVVSIAIRVVTFITALIIAFVTARPVENWRPPPRYSDENEDDEMPLRCRQSGYADDESPPDRAR